jgi:hypothetical protein
MLAVPLRVSDRPDRLRPSGIAGIAGIASADSI